MRPSKVSVRPEDLLVHGCANGVVWLDQSTPAATELGSNTANLPAGRAMRNRQIWRLPLATIPRTPAPATSSTLPPSCRTSRRWRSIYSARQQVRCARRLPKWHGNPGAVFAEQAVTPSQEQVKTSPHSKRFTAGHFSTESIPAADLSDGKALAISIDGRIAVAKATAPCSTYVVCRNNTPKGPLFPVGP